jgi:hypothetical protein
MKKTTLLFLLLLSAVGVKAQTYNFSVSQETYADLAGSTSMNNNQVWDYDEFGPVAIPFSFSIAGEAVNRFDFVDDYFIFLAPGATTESDEGVFFVDASTAFIRDRTVSTGTSSSPISYKVDGATGSRILKLEVKNAGLESAADLGYDEDEFFMNFQIWLYESNGTIEIHYGDNNIEDLDVLDTAGLLWAGVSGSTNAYFVYGESADPTYTEFTEQTFPEEGLTMDAFPANGTVYKFTPAGVAGVKDFSKSAISLYPNPATTVLNLKSNSFASADYEIYDILGKRVAANKMATGSDVQINIENLNEGVYFVKTNGQYLKFIKK